MLFRSKFRLACAIGAAASLALGSLASAAPVVTTFEGMNEAFYGASTVIDGMTFHSVNGVSGVFPDGSTFIPADTGEQVIIENATIFYEQFPQWGSAINALTFGSAYINGNNLSLGALSTVSVDLPTASNAASFDIAYYENGPWGGIVYHLDALLDGLVVASDTFTLSDEGGRDNIALNTLSVDGVTFDSLHIYATFGSEYSAPRVLIDNLSVTAVVPEPAACIMLAPVALMLTRRRR